MLACVLASLGREQQRLVVDSAHAPVITLVGTTLPTSPRLVAPLRVRHLAPPHLGTIPARGTAELSAI
ncbi:hypothetical protein HNR30_007814 [Nonomuraea soli]|uniref:Uncharacterized protein n=1 Tax=Nonomuraea soli TaxID=1032476 RepID=A0A7W0HUQ8_9ACTN|nr:hypothetical protein [Nonomuraea soli]